MKNLSDFKKRLKENVGKPIQSWGMYREDTWDDLGEREVMKVQTNCFYLKTKFDSGLYGNSRSDFPKARHFEIIDEDTVQFNWEVQGEIKPILRYKFI